MGAHLNGFRDLYTRGLRVFDIKATCDSVEANARQKSESVADFQGSKPRVYTNLDDMLRSESLDCVDIALPHSIHHAVACTCLERGLDVIIEKPLGITMRAARLTMEKAQKHSRTLAVAENYRRSPANRAIWWAIRQGMLGEPRMILYTAANWGPEPWGWREDKYASGGSWVFDGGVHIADLDRYHLSREATDVYAVCETFDPVKKGVKVTVDDMTMAIVRYEDKVYSQWIWTRAAAGKSAYGRMIYGSKGSINEEALTLQKERSTEIYGIGSLMKEMAESLGPEQNEKMFPKGATDTIVDGRKPEVDGREAYRDMAIPLGFYESTVLGSPVRVRDVEELKVERYQKDINEKLGI